MQWWLALAEVTADMGPMRFIDGSHREGPLGSVFNDDGGGDLLDLYPKLAERLTPPMEYEPGDATVHVGHTVHGSLPNLTDRTRISYIFQYIPADTRYWDGQGPENENPGSKRKPLDDVRYPTLGPRGMESVADGVREVQGEPGIDGHDRTRLGRLQRPLRQALAPPGSYFM
jgi:hypothetical protein